MTSLLEALQLKMADDMDRVVVEDPAACVKFSISGENLNKSHEKDNEIEPANGSVSKGRSRFKVAKVEFVDEQPKTTIHSDDTDSSDSELQTQNGEAGDNRVARLSHVSARSRQESVCSDGPTSPTDTYTQTYDTRNLKTFGKNTLETLPHLDHYRNLLTATGGIRKRPTLLELHEQEMVRLS